jgi:hypothetical protein
MSFSIVQQATAYASAGSGAISFLFPNNMSSGNHCLVFIRCGGTDSQLGQIKVSGIATNAGYQVVRQDVWGHSPGATDRDSEIWIGSSISGQKNLEIALNGNSTYGVFVTAYEISGTLTTHLSTTNKGQGGTVQTNGVTTTAATSRVIAFLWDSNDSLSSSMVPSGWTEETAAEQPSQALGSGNVNSVIHQDQTSTGTYSATWTNTSTVDAWIAYAISLE